MGLQLTLLTLVIVISDFVVQYMEDLRSYVCNLSA